MLFKTNTVIGHRGCRDVMQNNTIEAFRKAKEWGAEMVEMDVRRTRDGVLVVWHDSMIEDMRLRAWTYEELAKKANSLGKVFPTLEDVLKALEGQITLLVELKEVGYEAEVVGLLLKYFTPNEFAVISSYDEVIAMVKKGFPTVRGGLIIGLGSAKAGGVALGWGRFVHKMSEVFPWRRMRACGADFLAVNWKMLFSGLAGRAWRRKVQMVVWVVDEPKMVAQLMKTRRFNGIITNYPGMAVKLRKDL